MLDTVGVYVLKETIERKQFQNITFYGTAQNEHGEPIAGVKIDVMDANANTIGNAVTDDSGRYQLKRRIEFENGVPPDVENDYWFFAEHNSIYDSKNPVQDLTDPNKYLVSFLFKDSTEVGLELVVYDSITGQLLSDYQVTIVDEFSDENRTNLVENEKLKINLPEKTIGDLLFYSIKVEKEGYEPSVFSYDGLIFKKEVFQLSTKLLKIELSEIVIAGVCVDNKGNPISGVDLDLMDPMANMLANVSTNDKGAYQFKVTMKTSELENVDIRSDYWVFAKYKDNYDTKNPSEVEKNKKYKANFMFNTNLEFALVLNVTDEETKEKLNDIQLTLIDNFTSKKKETTIQNGAFIFNLKDKKVDEPISFTIQLEKEKYRTKSFTYETTLDTTGIRKIFETMARREFKEYTFTGLVKTPQGDRLKGVDIDLMDAAGDFVGSASTNEDGNFLFTSMIEIVPEEPVDIEEPYWLFAKYKEFYDSKNPQPTLQENRFYTEFIFDEEPEISFNLDISDQTEGVALDRVKITVTDNITKESKVIVPERSRLKIGLSDKNVGDAVDYHIKFEKEGYDIKEVEFRQKFRHRQVFM